MPAAKPAFPRLQRGKSLAVGLGGGWPAYEGAGPTLHDLSGNGVDGTLNGDLAWGSGQHGWCLHYPGVNGYVSFGDRLDIGTNPKWSYGGWFRSTAGASEFRALLTKSLAGNQDGRWFTIFQSGFLFTQLQLTGLNIHIDVSETGLIDGTWHHCFTTMDRNGNMTFYLDGKLATAANGTTNPVSIAGDAGANYNTANLLVLGAYPDSSGTTVTQGYWKGDLDGWLVYPRLLSASEVAALYADSWRIYRRPPWRLRKAGGNAYSLSIGAGSYALSGSAVTPAVGHKIAVSSNSYALTGGAVTPALGHKVPVGGGVYTLSGTAVSLRATRRSAINSGAYALSGSSVGTRRGYTLPVQSNPALLNWGDSYDSALAIDTDSTGRLLVVAPVVTLAGDSKFGVVRLNSDGTPDNTFGQPGPVAAYRRVPSFPSSTYDQCWAVKVLTGDKLLVAGVSQPTGVYLWGLVRLNSDGTVDTGFGASGYVQTDWNSSEAVVACLAVQADNKIVAGGYAWDGSFTNRSYVLARYSTAGVLDAAGFGTGGKVTISFGGADEQCFAVAVQPVDQKIVTFGFNTGATAQPFCLARLNTDGSLDTGFGTGGKVTTDLTSVGSVAGACFCGLVLPSGKILAGGGGDYGALSAGKPAAFVVIRYNADGSLDNSFGSGGISYLQKINGLRGYAVGAMGVQSSGKIVCFGQILSSATHGPTSLFRLNTDGSLDTTFGRGGITVFDSHGQADEYTGNSGSLVVLGDDSVVVCGFGGSDHAVQHSYATRVSPDGSLAWGGSGAYGLTGSPAGLARALRLATGAGSYTLAGSAVSPRCGRILPVGTGAYSLLGSPVTLTYSGAGRTLTVDSGTYTHIGSAVGLPAGRRLTINPGSYTYLGSSVSLLIGRRLPILQGSFLLSGAAVALSSTRRLPTGPGSFLLNGTAVSLTASRRLAAGSGSYTYLGSPVTLNYSGSGRNLLIGSGTYALAGGTVTLRATRVLPATPGAYGLTGAPITLRAGHLPLTVGGGSYILTGTAVGLGYEHSIRVVGGIYGLVGGAVNFPWRHVLKVGSVAYSLNGSTVTLTYSGVSTRQPPAGIVAYTYVYVPGGVISIYVPGAVRLHVCP